MRELTTDKNLTITDCGLAGYKEILSLQQRLLADRQMDKIPNTILLLEHPSVITLGARKSENKLLVAEDMLKSMGIETVAVGRGGAATAHNPGQIVIYPILKLKSPGPGITEYIRQLEQIGIDLLAELDVSAGRRKGLPGLWIENQKIASVGVQVKKWTTFHGMAVNINNDLSIFDYIVPCGIDGVKMTSVKELTGAKTAMPKVKQILVRHCRRCWAMKR